LSCLEHATGGLSNIIERDWKGEGFMDQRNLTETDGGAVDDQMVRDMELRRQARPERRQRGEARTPVSNERRRTCAFCFQPGDHPTPTHCLRALER
jgi:hypothetical protein